MNEGGERRADGWRAVLARLSSSPNVRGLMIIAAGLFVPTLVCLGAVAVVVLAARRQFQPHLSDHALEQFFWEHRESLTRLAELSLRHEEIEHMSRGELDLRSGQRLKAAEYSDPDWVELGRLLAALPLVRGTLICNEQVYLYNLCRGMAPGDCKGYVFTTREPAPLLDSLDRPPSHFDGYKRAYKKIDDNWYLLYEVFRGNRHSNTGCEGTFEAPVPNGSPEWVKPRKQGAGVKRPAAD